MHGRGWNLQDDFAQCCVLITAGYLMASVNSFPFTGQEFGSKLSRVSTGTVVISCKSSLKRVTSRTPWWSVSVLTIGGRRNTWWWACKLIFSSSMQNYPQLEDPFQWKRERGIAGAREPGGGGARGQLHPQLFVSMGWICLCPPKIWQSLGISTLLPPPPPRKNRSRAPAVLYILYMFYICRNI